VGGRNVKAPWIHLDGKVPSAGIGKAPEITKIYKKNDKVKKIKRFSMAKPGDSKVLIIQGTNNSKVQGIPGRNKIMVQIIHGANKSKVQIIQGTNNNKLQINTRYKK
jgi:hypothetical protein